MILELQKKSGRFTHLNLNIHLKATVNDSCGIGKRTDLLVYTVGIEWAKLEIDSPRFFFF